MSQDYTPDHKQPLPYWYQANDMHALYSYLIAGEFAQVIGVGGSGKSNFVRHITSDAVKASYIGNQQANSFLTIYIDPHMVVKSDNNDWAGYEIMINRLRRELIKLHEKNANFSENILPITEKIGKSYANLYSANERVANSGIRHLEDSIYEVLSLGEQWQIVFVFDEFDKLLADMSAHFFRALQGLRADFKGHLMYVTSTRNPLDHLCQEMKKEDYPLFEDFIELFNGFELFMSPLDNQSAHQAVNRLEERNNIVINNDIRMHLLNSTAGHASLLRRAFYITRHIPPNTLYRDFITHLVNTPSIEHECEMIFNSLSVSERDIILNIVRQSTTRYPNHLLNLLSNKNIFKNDSQRLRIPVFEAWLQKYNGKPQQMPD